MLQISLLSIYTYYAYSIRHKIKTLQMKRFKIIYRSCNSQFDVLRNRSFWNGSIFTGKHLYWTLFLIKLQALTPATLLKSGSNKRVFWWMLQIFKNSFSIEHIRWLLLCQLEREEEESMEQRSEEKFFKWKKKWKHFIIQLRKY